MPRQLSLYLVLFTACSMPATEHSALCGSDAGADAMADAPPDTSPDAPLIDAGPCNPNPPTTYVDPGGLHSNVVIQKPSNYGSTCDTPRALLMFLGGYGSDTGFSRQINMGFRYVKNLTPDGTLVLTPNGAYNPNAPGVHYWNADPSCCDRAGVGNDDLAYLRGLLEWTIANYNVDRSRVIVLGASNGGFMAERLRCSASDLVTHIVDASGAGQSSIITCPGNALPVHAIIDHSLVDTGVKYDGGRQRQMLVDYVSVNETLAQNAGQSGCTSLHLETANAYDHDRDTAGAETDLLTYETCTGATVVHWRTPTSAHTFNQTFIAGCVATACTAPLATVWAVDVWNFVTNHPR